MKKYTLWIVALVVGAVYLLSRKATAARDRDLFASGAFQRRE